MTDRATVDEVRSRTDLVELVGQYVPLRRVGQNYIARCPFHEERTPSFNVNPEKGLYFCFGCKASGDALRFYEQIEGLTFPEALRALAEKAGIELPDHREPERIAEDRRQRDQAERLYAVCEAATAYFEDCLRAAPFSELARGALDERGVTPEVVAQFRLGYAPARWDGLAEHLRALKLSPADAELAGLLLPGKQRGHYDRFRHRLMFPVLDKGGRVVAFSGRVLPLSEEVPEGIVPEDAGKYINSPETPIYRKGEMLFGLSTARMAIRQRQTAVLVEGNFDVVQMHQHGFAETVAPLGTSFTDAQAKLLRRFAEMVILVFDGDNAGRKAARAAHPVCARSGLVARVGVLPPKVDPDSFLRTAPEQGGGRDAMAAVLEHSPGMEEWLIRDAAANAGETTHERIEALRSLAPVIAAVRDDIERGVYIRQTAKALHLEEVEVRQALREHQANVARAARESPFSAADVRRRPGLSPPMEQDAEGMARARRAWMAAAIEALLMVPTLLESAEAAEAADLLDEPYGEIVREARSQWVGERKLRGADLLQRAPHDKARAWLGARLMAGGDEDPQWVEQNAQKLRDAVARLRQARLDDQARLMKRQSARAGTQGDPASELSTLNERLQLQRELARSGTTKGG